MARTKGMLNLSGNLEVNAQAPLDARTIVPTEADLTVASNFPYPYVGLEVYVTGTDKKFRLTNLDTTQSSSWHEIGGGGGGETYSDFTGATASTAGAHGLVPAPSAGDDGRVLFGNGTWGALINSPNELPVLFDERGTEYQVGWYVNSSGLKKPVYEKVISFGSISRASNKTISITDLNIDNLISLQGKCATPYDEVFSIPTVHTASFQYQVMLRTNDNFSNVGVYTGGDVAILNTYITLRYTKTTDTYQ